MRRAFQPIVWTNIKIRRSSLQHSVWASLVRGWNRSPGTWYNPNTSFCLSYVVKACYISCICFIKIKAQAWCTTFYFHNEYKHDKGTKNFLIVASICVNSEVSSHVLFDSKSQTVFFLCLPFWSRSWSTILA